MLLGVKAVIAESFERIHRSNLVNMGVLPLQFKAGESAASLGLTGREVFDLVGLGRGADSARHGRRARARRGRPSPASSRRRPGRHARGTDGLPPRRHPAVRGAPPGEGVAAIAAGRGRVASGRC